jgi:hypothetical protein
MALLGLSQTNIAEFLKEPDTQHLLRSFVSSPEGRAAVESYLSSPDGPKMIRVLLPMILKHIDLHEQTKEEIQKSRELMR